MPALRNRLQAKQMANGEQISSSLVLKKKLLLLEEEEDEMKSNNNNNDNNSNSNPTTSEEDTFSDTQTMQVHNKLRLKLDRGANQDEAPIFRQNSQSAQDQFAVALLRLQLDLDETSKRLGELETKLDKISKGYQQQLQRQQAEAKARAKGGPFNSANFTNLLYFAWPIVVFAAVRAIERRTSSLSPVKI